MNKFLIVLLLMAVIFVGGCGSGMKMTHPEKQGEYPINRKAYGYFLNGELYDFQDQYEKALIEYYQALLYDSTSAQIYKVIGRDLIRLQQYESAAKYLEKAIRLDPNNREILHYLGEAYFNLKNYAKSVAYFEKLFKIDPYNSSVQNNLTFLYTHLKMNDRLVSFYRKLMEYYPGDTDRALQYAIACMKTKKLGEAEKVLTEVVRKDSSQLDAYLLLGNLYEQKKDTANAIRVYRKVLERDTKNQEILTRVYRMFRSREDWSSVEKSFLPVLRQDSSNVQVRLILAESYFFRKRYDDARKMLKPVLNEEDFRPAALELLGRIAFEEEDYPEAEQYFILLTKENPQNRFGWLFLTILYNRENKYENSLAVLRQALTFHKDDPDLLGLYGNTLSQLGRENEAIEPLKKALEANPDDVNAIAALAALYDKLKMWQKSDSLYEAALEKYPDNPLLLNNYSYSLSERGVQLERALQMINKALEKEPENGAYLDTKGWIYYQLGKYRQALEFVQKALEVRENSAEVIEHLGDIYYRLGQPEKARQYWEQALEKAPHNQELKEKLQNL